ncbi:hypothetical protein F5Y14DRAFT_299962 [Nemania sp. NC0429]|nr:hypothetical protein F5Y14DRAFT_299962 [Nemania sp. NC0429]
MNFFRTKKSPGLVADVTPDAKSTRDGPVSLHEKFKQYPQISRLSHDVKSNFMRGGLLGNERFLPNDKLEELVTEVSVLSALHETTIEQQHHKDLAKWVIESGKRLFLTLVLLERDSEEHLSSLLDLKNSGVNDSALPLGFSEGKTCYGYPLAGGAEGTQKFHAFRDWEDNNLIVFRVLQWIFFAPVFGTSTKFRHQLNSEQPVPILNMANDSVQDRVIGEVLHGELHLAHIDLQRLAALGVSNTAGLQGIPVSIKIVRSSDDLRLFENINTGRLKAEIPGLYRGQLQPIAAYEKKGEGYIIYRWRDDGDEVAN